jgi:hypothetical protein
MTEQHDWPLDKSAKGTLRPWFFSAKGYLAVLFRDGAEAERAARGLVKEGVPEEDMRLYTAEQIMNIQARLQEERSGLAKALAELTIDHAARRRYMEAAQAGGSALWLYAPGDDQADRLVQLLADYDYEAVRHYGDEGVETIRRRPD